MDLEKFVKKFQEYIVLPAASALKVALLSHRPVMRNAPASRPLIVMGNGPSLRSFIEYIDKEDPELPTQFDLEAVNFAAITPEFFLIRPRLYVLADPHFFRYPADDGKVTRLWENLARVSWPMILWVPARLGHDAGERLKSLPENVEIRRMNLTPIEGRGSLVNMLIAHGMGMPRPRNVLIPAIMTAIWSGYKKIFLVGADHSWSKTLWVDDENHVVSVQPHFYKDDENERNRVQAEYAGYHLHNILESLTVAFRSYFEIRLYAGRKGIEIINATPDSFIDAFPRCGYAQMKRQ